MSGKKLLPVVALLGIIVLCAVSVSLLLIHSGSLPASTSSTQRTLVIDAGHGGIDGGAISADGTKESDLNLAIALRLDSIVRFCGQKTVMTRLDDSKKTDMLSYSEREDLKNRADMVNDTVNAVLISIHQNVFPTAQPKGAQVLYSASEGSERLGKLLQTNLITHLDPENRRLACPAPKELYLTTNTSCPAVLVECGFMSNNFEVLKLKDPVYQTELAAVIAASYLTYIAGINAI
jgi:N-acetylmuramoyl-L-alanine amidase